MQLNQYIGNISCSSQNEEGFSEILSRISIKNFKKSSGESKVDVVTLGCATRHLKQRKKKQECIPVGCVPTSSVASTTCQHQQGGWADHPPGGRPPLVNRMTDSRRL